ATITYSVTAGALPTGLTLSTAGVISGTPTVPGNYTGTVTATNGAAPDATQNFNITIGGIAPVITSGAPGDGTESVAYNHTYTATGSATITYSVTAGALPTGLTLSTAGVISGTPTVPGNYTGTVTATNGAAPDATQNFNITIAVPTAAPVITSAAPIDGTESVAYSHTYTATGTLPITYSVTAGALPTGLTLSSAGVISGTPTAVGTYTGTVTATNGTLPDATQNFTIVIGTVPVAPAVVELPAAPPAPLCTNVNFDENAGLRAHAPFDSMEVNCRMLIENGQYFNWNGGPLTNAGQIGNQSVLDLGVTQAVDVFSPVGRAQFEGDVVICLRGTGTLIYFNANQSPRTPQVITGWTTPAFPGFTCGTLYQPGTLVLVSRPPQ
ncbi:MAG: putative Ig domain-containing protein, partial [Anaerolineae bacterium]|nr:putative Ig domain-containing protein [Anaerolineae bacterium]